ncbi:MAG TPA: AAA family ATPase [Tepidisphaeraceae bacterium]|jgi:RecA-family ATPase|nr:AAA family ATPase [Tepidisphaeraceae bacterium]
MNGQTNGSTNGAPPGGRRHPGHGDDADRSAWLRDIVDALGGDPRGSPDPDPADAKVEAAVPLSVLMRDNPELRRPIIIGCLRAGQVGNLISTSKSYKTYLILDLAISMSEGSEWLGRFGLSGGRVLLVDLELQPPDIARAKGTRLDALGERIHVMSFRGRNATIEHVERHLLAQPAGRYELVVIDPLYKCYPEKFDENSNADMTNLYRRFERIAERMAARW